MIKNIFKSFGIINNCNYICGDFVQSLIRGGSRREFPYGGLRVG